MGSPTVPLSNAPTAAPQTTGLDRLAIGDRARVVRIIGADEITARLFEMGLTPGLTVALIGCAPLGDPIELELRGYRLSLRKTEAARVEVEKLA
jgi:ferrous iron transport protein A